MTREEAQKVLDELNTVRIEVLNDKAKRLFEAIMKIADERDKLREELDLKDKIIDLMAEELVKAHEWFYSEFDNYTKEDFIKYFERKVEGDK